MNWLTADYQAVDGFHLGRVHHVVIHFDKAGIALLYQPGLIAGDMLVGA
jgi:hypothetical protein